VEAETYFLGTRFYGCAARVTEHSSDELLSVRLAVPGQSKTYHEPHFTNTIAGSYLQTENYHPSYVVAKMLGISGIVLSRITSAFLLVFTAGNGSEQKVNLGLNLKFEGKGLKVLGYSRKTSQGWEFSFKAIKLLEEYTNKFPLLFQRMEKNCRTSKHATYNRRSVPCERLFF
jgi:5'-3' exoribonuclease 1